MKNDEFFKAKNVAINFVERPGVFAFIMTLELNIVSHFFMTDAMVIQIVLKVQKNVVKNAIKLLVSLKQIPIKAC